MIIKKKRIRSIDNNIFGVKKGERIAIGIRDLKKHKSALKKIGFSNELIIGESILPAIIGPATRFNAEGKYIIHRDKPKETAYRQREWTWKEFRGRDETVERSKIVEIPYERYQRTFIEPPSLEISLKKTSKNDDIAVSKSIVFDDDNEKEILNAVNVFLEIFGECEIFHENLDQIINAKIIRINWEVLPKGKLPWQILKTELKKIVDKLRPGNRTIINQRHEFIGSHNPEFVAIGQGGFWGYAVFGFPQKNLYILESSRVNNATYVLENNWEEISGLTKAELINEKLHKERIIHRENWFTEMARVLSGAANKS